MQAKQRLITALDRGVPDRLPVTTHHVMHYFLAHYMDGATNDDFFDRFGLDPIEWVVGYQPSRPDKEYFDPRQTEVGFLQGRGIVADDWRVETRDITADPSLPTTRYTIVTPKGNLTLVLQGNQQTAWLLEHPIKEKRDIELLAKYMTTPHCDVDAVNAAAERCGDRALVRGHVCSFDFFGQPGCWQDACCLVGTEKMILAAHDDPDWVHDLLGILQRRKLAFIRSLAGARYDILELGGGDASTTVISPKMFHEFVAPYDAPLIEAAHQAGQRIVYHTCGGMMPILEDIADMKPDAMETLTPPSMGGDTDLAEAKRRIGDRVCLIGGFDQFHFFQRCTPAETRDAVRRCFEEAGDGGGYILSPSDHFFDADVDLIAAFADEARKCVYA